MDKRLKLFWNGYMRGEIDSFGLCKKKGEIITSIRARQVQEYKKINAKQIEARKELSL